jgi:hypothetical protein
MERGFAGIGPPVSVFVLTVEATAGPANAEPDGRRYPILVFASGETEEAAGVVARAGLADRGWNEVAVLRTGEITDPGAVPDDMKATMDRALAYGCALIVYDAP